MKTGDKVKFTFPLDEREKESVMEVLELRGERVLVTDLRFEKERIKPTFVFLMSDLTEALND